jgi:hypothetical protein
VPPTNTPVQEVAGEDVAPPVELPETGTSSNSGKDSVAGIAFLFLAGALALIGTGMVVRRKNVS